LASLFGFGKFLYVIRALDAAKRDIRLDLPCCLTCSRESPPEPVSMEDGRVTLLVHRVFADRVRKFRSA
jgi:hypothetical protein